MPFAFEPALRRSCIRAKFELSSMVGATKLDPAFLMARASEVKSVAPYVTLVLTYGALMWTYSAEAAKFFAACDESGEML